jgi:hypothetical protein
MAANPYDIRNIIPVINDTEQEYLVKLFQDPVVIKYFQSFTLNAVFEIALSPPDAKISDMEFRINQAFNKGIISVMDQILGALPAPKH